MTTPGSSSNAAPQPAEPAGPAQPQTPSQAQASVQAQAPAQGQEGGAGHRAFAALAYLAMAAVCAQGLWHMGLWKTAEPRVMDIARDQYTHGLLRSLTFAGMPFLEKPPLYFDLNALAFGLGGGASVQAARVVVTLLAMLWLACTVLVVRRAAGPRAGLLAGALLAAAPGFAGLTRRLGVDIAMVAMLSLAMLLLFLSLRTERERVDGRWWYASLVAAGLAALSKGVFGSFLFLAPTLVYAWVAGDRRVLAALRRPLSWLLLLLPHLLWGAVLYHDGGVTFLFEHFINNTVGRAVHLHFDVAGAGALPYGDVGVPYPWYYYLRTLPVNTLPAVLALPCALSAQRTRGGLRARDPESRLFTLALCWGLVPPLLLSFSSYKGRGHLAASVSALVIVGSLWIFRRLPRPALHGAGRRAWASVMALLALIPLLVLATQLGLPATQTGARILLGLLLVGLLVGLAASRGLRQPALALAFLLATLGAVFVVDFSPGNNLADDQRNSLDSSARWVAEQVGDAPLGVFVPRVFLPPGDYQQDPIGRVEERDLASLWYWLGRPVERLGDREQIRAFLERSDPAFVLACRPRSRPVEWPAEEPAAGWIVTGGNAKRLYTLIANRAAAAIRPQPSRPAPDVTGESGPS